MLKTSKLHPNRPPLTQTHRSYLIVKMYFMMYYCHVVWIVVSVGQKESMAQVCHIVHCLLANTTSYVFANTI